MGVVTKPIIYKDPKHAWWTTEDRPWIMAGRSEDSRPQAHRTWADALRFALMPSEQFAYFCREDMGG